MLEKMIKRRNIYGRTLVKIPTPKFAVFYNGEEGQPEKYELKLSDAFECPVEESELELKCTVYNINRGRNQGLLEKCTFLKEYMIFVDYVRSYLDENETMDLDQAIQKAIDQCIRENVLRDFLTERRSEVTKVMTLDYTFERQIMLEREEAQKAQDEAVTLSRAEGMERGLKKGMEKGKMLALISLTYKKYAKDHTAEATADLLEEDVETIRKIYEAIKRAGSDDTEKIYEAIC